MKPGFLTSEFWVTAAIEVVGLIALFGGFTPEQSAMLNTDIPQMGALAQKIITDVIAFGSMIVAAYKYITGRSEVKKAREMARRI